MMTFGILPRRSTGSFAATPLRNPRSRHCPFSGVFASRTLLASPAKLGHRDASAGTCARHVRFVHSPALR